MHYLSLDTVIYRPDGLRDIVLCQYDDVMAELVEVKPSVQLQREFVIGSPWMHQASRGNASLQMSFTVVRAFTTFGRARAWGLDLQETLTLHPEGVAAVGEGSLLLGRGLGVLAGVLGLPHHKGQGEQNHHQDEGNPNDLFHLPSPPSRAYTDGIRSWGAD